MKSSGGIFDIDGKRKRLAELEEQTAAPGFWDNREVAQTILKETKLAKTRVDTYDKSRAKLDDAMVLVDLAIEAEDEGSAREAEGQVVELQRALSGLEFQRMLGGENDPLGAVVDINAGAGGVDAADWALMLLRMILRYCEKKGWKAEVLDEQPAETAGIRSATVLVSGDYAYGHLKAETGVHRLVRISPFDANARRQTSFAAVSVTPDIDDEIEVDINEGDLRFDYYRAGGAGGQHVNKTESAVRVTHLPTGVVVQCQNERSQHKNKSQAMRVLRSRLYDYYQAEKDKKTQAANSEKKKIEWGSQIRSYVLAPYRMVNDHRTEVKVGNVDAVLEGDLDEFVRAYLLSQGTA